MKIDKTLVKINRIGINEIPLLVEYRLTYLAELQREKNDTKKIS